MAQLELGDGVGYLIISPKDMVELKAIKLLQLPNLLPVWRHSSVAAVQLPHDLVDNELKVTANIKPLDPKLDGDAQALDECLVFRHIVGCVEV
jgi:hypothetical protein